VGSALGPVISGLAMSEFGRFGLPYVGIAAQALMALWGAYRSLRRPSPLKKETFVLEAAVPVGTRLSPAHDAVH
jgi:hypothetical protein